MAVCLFIACPNHSIFTTYGLLRCTYISIFIKGEIKDKIGSNSLNIDYEFLTRNRQPQPDPWGYSQPHNAWSETPWWQKVVIKAQTRIQSGVLKADAVFHRSIFSAPLNLNNPMNMITLTSLKQAFGDAWVPDSPPLNAFEQECKNAWGLKVRIIFY